MTSLINIYNLAKGQQKALEELNWFIPDGVSFQEFAEKERLDVENIFYDMQNAFLPIGKVLNRYQDEQRKKEEDEKNEEKRNFLVDQDRNKIGKIKPGFLGNSPLDRPAND